MKLGTVRLWFVIDRFLPKSFFASCFFLLSFSPFYFLLPFPSILNHSSTWRVLLLSPYPVVRRTSVSSFSLFCMFVFGVHMRECLRLWHSVVHLWCSGGLKSKMVETKVTGFIYNLDVLCCTGSVFCWYGCSKVEVILCNSRSCMESTLQWDVWSWNSWGIMLYGTFQILVCFLLLPLLLPLLLLLLLLSLFSIWGFPYMLYICVTLYS